MHHLASLFLKFSLQAKISYQIASDIAPVWYINLQFQILSECTIYRPCFQMFLCISKLFQMLSECTIYSRFFLKCSLHFQIPSECTIYRPCFHQFLCSSKWFQIPSEYTCFRDIVFNFFSAVQNRVKYCQNVWKYKGLFVIRYILNTERKVYNYFLLNFVVKSLLYFKEE